MLADNMSEAAIASFRHNYEQLVNGVTGLLPESEILPVESLPHLSTLTKGAPPPAPCRRASRGRVLAR